MEGSESDELRQGLYDIILSDALATRVADLGATHLRAQLDAVDPAELPDRIGEIIGRWAHGAVSAAPTDKRAEMALALTADFLDALIATSAISAGPEYRLASALQRLVAVEPISPSGEPIPIARPLTPLRDTVLMTNARDQPTVGTEIAAEIDSADRIDLVLAFIRWTASVTSFPLSAVTPRPAKPYG